MKVFKILNEYTGIESEHSFISEWESKGWKYTKNFNVLTIQDMRTLADPYGRFPKSIAYEFEK